MGNFTMAATFIILINVFMLIFNVSVQNVTDSDFNVYNCKGTVFELFDQDCQTYQSLNTTSVQDYYPSSGSTIASTGSDYTDFFKLVKEFFSSGFGLKWVMNVLLTPGRMITSMNIPLAISYSLSALWYLLTFLSFIAFFLGRE